MSGTDAARTAGPAIAGAVCSPRSQSARARRAGAVGLDVRLARLRSRDTARRFASRCRRKPADTVRSTSPTTANNLSTMTKPRVGKRPARASTRSIRHVHIAGFRRRVQPGVLARRPVGRVIPERRLKKIRVGADASPRSARRCRRCSGLHGRPPTRFFRRPRPAGSESSANGGLAEAVTTLQPGTEVDHHGPELFRPAGPCCLRRTGDAIALRSPCGTCGRDA